MCGLAGVLDLDAAMSAEQLDETARMMATTLWHRGPDAGGTWCDPAAGIALGHRRLKILDLSEQGDQPMRSASGRYVLVFNGELYNFRELRRELAGHPFRGTSDTEVLCEAIAAWGLERALERANGMFALAVWDAERRVLRLARDRLGEKPLCYTLIGRHFTFGSDLRALRAHPGFAAPLDPAALALFLRYSFVPGPWTPYEGVRKLPPGTVLTVDANGGGSLSEPRAYWSAVGAVEAARGDPFTGSLEEAADALEALLADAVRIRMTADVPVGAFLSGGVDSSMVTALMQRAATSPVRTFTVAVGDPGLDEAARGRRIAAHLGTEHLEVKLDANAALDVIGHLPRIYDEPFADPSQIPTLLVARAAREHVTVGLTGDGGDEVFGGYNRYTYGARAWRVIARSPRRARSAAARILLGVPAHRWDRIAAVLRSPVPYIGDKLHKLGGVLGADSAEALHLGLASHWARPGALLGIAEPAVARRTIGGLPPAEQMMAWDAVTALPDDMLVKVDRATMHVALEARVPLLDHRVFEFAWRLPATARIANGVGKAVLRAVLARHVPEALTEGPKIGFDPPIADWLRGPLRGWADERLHATTLAHHGIADPAAVRAVWAEHLGGRRNHDYRLWIMLMLTEWLEGQCARSRSVR
ncbi:MAG: asparagine synthase (glutamine-hydrolyzing) [Egibacteraceae bacterium]